MPPEREDILYTTQTEYIGSFFGIVMKYLRLSSYRKRSLLSSSFWGLKVLTINMGSGEGLDHCNTFWWVPSQ
jgi:hypothetical protein